MIKCLSPLKTEQVPIFDLDRDLPEGLLEIKLDKEGAGPCLYEVTNSVSDPTPGVWGRPRGTSAGLYRGLPYKPGHAYETNPRHRRGNRGSERRVREAEEDTREAEEDKE